MRGMDPESKSADMRHNVNDSRSEYSKVQRNRNIRNGLIFIAPNFIGFFHPCVDTGAHAVLHIIHQVERARRPGIQRVEELASHVYR